MERHRVRRDATHDSWRPGAARGARGNSHSHATVREAAAHVVSPSAAAGSRHTSGPARSRLARSRDAVGGRWFGPRGDRVKIGITCYPTYGGSGALATELGIALARRGHEIHFITYQQPFRLPAFLPRIYFHEVDVGRYPLFEYPPYDLALAVRMHQVVLAHKLDLLHVHYAIPHATSAWIAREMLIPTRPDIKVLTTLHGTDITIVGQDPSFHAITKFSIEQSDGLTAVSRFLQRETVRAFGCTGCEIEVIPDFIDPGVYDRAKYKAALSDQVAATNRVLMPISTSRPVKRVRDVVRAFA